MPKGWHKIRARILSLEPLCRRCRAKGRATAATEVDHIIPRAQGGSCWDDNLQSLCEPCHTAKTATENGSHDANGSVRPEWLPKPRCRVELVCGPYGSGKSTYVAERARPADIVIDLDEIAAQLSGLPMHEAGKEWVGRALYERNRRLAKLAGAAAATVAWVIVSAPSAALREWWRAKLDATSLHVLDVSEAECARRIGNDDTRSKAAKARQLAAAADWWKIERGQKTAHIRKGCDVAGMPTDPLHPWHQGNAC